MDLHYELLFVGLNLVLLQSSEQLAVNQILNILALVEYLDSQFKHSVYLVGSLFKQIVYLEDFVVWVKQFLTQLKEIGFRNILEKVFFIVKAKNLLEIISEVEVQDVYVFHLHQRLKDVLGEVLPKLKLNLDVDVVELVNYLHEIFFPHS